MTVHAPFRFAPINRWVYFPEWEKLVSHDVPFADGVSGEITVELKATTPLLIGGPRREATDRRAGEVWPFRLGDGAATYAIPSSTIQGLTRSILEIAGFGKLGPWVDVRRFGIRDLNPQAIPFYRRRLINNVKAGFMRDEGGCWRIEPCTLHRIGFADIPRQPGGSLRFEDRSTPLERYKLAKSTGPYRFHLDGPRGRLTPDPEGSAWLVITGNTGARGKAAKSKEFVFEETGEQAVDIDSDVKRDFLYIHQGPDPKDPNRWSEVWRHFYETGYAKGNAPVPFKAGGSVPVFYIEENGRIASIGLAFMFKLAHERTTEELLANSSPDHSNESRSDLASLIFGSKADDNGNAGLKRRASFDVAVVTLPSGQREQRSAAATVLLSPKPSYYPIYVRQVGSGGQLPGNMPYVTYTPIDGYTPEHERPELAGVKIWPARPDQQATRFPHLMPAPPNTGNKVQVSLNALPAGTCFRTNLRLHNLRPSELGAILWALSFGNPAALEGKWGNLRHRLGMGKPFGMGQVQIRITASNIIANRDQQLDKRSLREFVASFEALMTDAYRRAQRGGSWAESVQVKALHRAADPARNSRADIKLDYMVLGDSKQANQASARESSYLGEKRLGHFLEPYETGYEAPKPGSGSGAAPRDVQSVQVRHGAQQSGAQQRSGAGGQKRAQSQLQIPQPGTRMWDVDEATVVVVHGPGHAPGTVLAEYEDDGESVELPMSRLASL